MHRIPNPPTPPDPNELTEALQRVVIALARLERRLDEFADVYLNARFPYGKPTDRWRRRGAA